jgi:holliday junction DNA helicase RuvB
LSDDPEPTEASVLAYLQSHPAAAPAVRSILVWASRHPAPFAWYEVRVFQRALDRLTMDGILDRLQGARYVLRSSQEVARGLVRYDGEVRAAREDAARPGPEPPKPAGAPAGFLDELVGYTDAKRITLMALAARRPTHILYIGPPASGKSLFMEGLSSLPGAVYRFGDAVTKAGLRSVLFSEKPPIICIDEIDKMPDEEASALLEFMERQVVSQLKYGSNREEAVEIRVFAAANRVERMMPELLSRFWKVQLAPYTQEEFVRVVTLHLSKKGVERGLAGFIAEGVGNRTRDVRDAVRISNMSRTSEDARFLMGQLGREVTV